MIEVRAATTAEIGGFYARLGPHWVAVDDGEAIALASLSKVGTRWWATFNVLGQPEDHGAAIVRALKAGLHRHNQTTHITCQFPRAERLLRVLGFIPTDEMVDGRRVWVWQPRLEINHG